jgi:hypothetical protein
MSENYFTFPLAVLNGEIRVQFRSVPIATPLNCIELALDSGILSGGKGFKKIHKHEEFKDELAEICDKWDIGKSSRPGPYSPRAEVLVGASICKVNMPHHSGTDLDSLRERVESVPTGGPLVRMKGDYLWAAVSQARAEADPEKPWPERGMSWREFRILCAILSVKTNRAGFAFMGWETIQARAHGFTTKEAFKSRKVLADHLAPPLSHKQIRATRDTLEALGFFARFRLSSGGRGGLMAYSVRHDPDELAKAVCESVNFRDRAGIKANRAKDAEKCLELLERAKSGQSRGKGRGKHNEKSHG